MHFYSDYSNPEFVPLVGISLSLQGLCPGHQTSPGAVLPTGLHHVKGLGVNSNKLLLILSNMNLAGQELSGFYPWSHCSNS